MITTSSRSLLVKSVVGAATVGAFMALTANSALVFGYGSSSSGSSNNNSSSSSGGSVQGASTTCNDSKPGSAPVLTAITPSGANSLTLTWAKAQGPVSYYLVTYGTKPGEQLYGNPNVGDGNTTSYTVNSLSGGSRYYFKVRAGNGCMPGAYSNELAGIPGGRTILTTRPAAGFIPGVLGAQTSKPQPVISVPVEQPAPVITTQPIKPQPVVEATPEQAQDGILGGFVKWLLKLIGK